MNLKPFRALLRQKLKEEKLTLNSLSSISELSEDTLRSIIYGQSKDVKLSTLIKLADVFNCSLDELVNRYTYSQDISKIINRISRLPKQSLNVIMTVITLEEKCIVQKSTFGLDTIPVFIPKNDFHDEMYYDGSTYKTLDISAYPISLKDETSFGLMIESNFYDPIYQPNDIILISVKHKPKYYDIVICISNTGKIFIRKYTELGLEPIGNFGEIIPSKELNNYTAIGVVIKTVKEFDIEQYR